MIQQQIRENTTAVSITVTKAIMGTLTAIITLQWSESMGITM